MEQGVTIFKERKAVDVRRDMAKVPAVMEALGPVEKTVFLASTAKTVTEHTDTELMAELTRSLKFIARDVGYKDTNESERGYLIVRVSEILKRYYPSFTMKDFRMAFEMSITGELDDYLPKGRDGQADRGHYQQFNAEYICKILNAYRMRRAAILKKAKDAMPSEPEKPMNPEEAARLSDMTRKDCVEVFGFFKANGYMPEISPIAEMLYYNILVDAGLAKEVVVTIDDQRDILKRTISRYISKGMTGDALRLKDAGPEAKEIQHDAFTSARRKALKAAFEEMVKNNIEIEKYVRYGE